MAKATRPSASDPSPIGHNSKTPASLPRTIVNALPTSAEIMRHVLAIADLVPKLSGELKTAKAGGAVSMARAFTAFHRLNKRMDEEFKPLGALYDEYKVSHVPILFEQEGVPNVPLEEGFRVGVSYRFVASIIAAKKDQAYNWLTTNGMGDIVVTTVNAQTLSAALKALRDEKNIDAPSEFFTTADLPNTSVTTTK